jgi:hypothetical protein
MLSGIMLSVTNNTIMHSVIMLSVVATSNISTSFSDYLLAARDQKYKTFFTSNDAAE